MRLRMLTFLHQCREKAHSLPEPPRGVPELSRVSQSVPERMLRGPDSGPLRLSHVRPRPSLLAPTRIFSYLQFSHSSQNHPQKLDFEVQALGISEHQPQKLTDLLLTGKRKNRTARQPTLKQIALTCCFSRNHNRKHDS